MKRAIGFPGIILVALYGLIPIALAPGVFLEMGLTPKIAIAFIGMACLIACAESWWPGLKGMAQTRSGRLFAGLLMAQALSLLVSTAFSGDWHLALFGTTSHRFGAINQLVILFLTLVTASYCFLRRHLIAPLLLAVEAVGGLTAIYGILQYFGWDPWQEAQTYNNTYNALRIPSTFGHAIVFANFLLPVVLIGGSSLVTDSRRKWQWLHGVVLAMAITALLLTGTRSALLGLGAGVLTLSYFRNKGANKRKMLWLYAGGAIFLLLVVLLTLSPAGEKFRVRAAQWRGDIKGGTRLLTWRDSGELIRSHWLVGIGPEAFGREFQKVQSLELANAFPDTYHESPHSLFLEVAVCGGLLGLSILICFLALAAYSGFRRSRSGDLDSRVLLACLLASIVSLQFAPLAFVNVMYLYLFAALLFWMPCPEPKEGKIARFSPFVRGLVLTGAAGVAAIGSIFVLQDFYFAQMARRLAQADLEGAMESYAAAQSFPLPGEQLWCSRQLAILARSSGDDRRAAFLAAAKRTAADAELCAEEQSAAYYQSGILALLTGDLREAEAKLRQSTMLAPRWYRPRAMLANVLLEQGRLKESEQEEKLALDGAGIHRDEIRETRSKISEQLGATGPPNQ